MSNPASHRRDLSALLEDVRSCAVCTEHLPDGPRPIVQVGTGARVVIIGQAPGRRVHASGIPWDDPSGDRLRQWLNLTSEQFYNPELIAIVPMGFCYPGSTSSGDRPRNNHWLTKNPWFEEETLLALRSRIAEVLELPIEG